MSTVRSFQKTAMNNSTANASINDATENKRAGINGPVKIEDKKRKARNLREKNRRDEMNEVINELGRLIGFYYTKSNKSAILEGTISFLHKFIARMDESTNEKGWLSSWLTNDELINFQLQTLNAFILIFNYQGRILDSSKYVTELLGYSPKEITNINIYDIIYEEDKTNVYRIIRSTSQGDYFSFRCDVKRGDQNLTKGSVVYESVNFVGLYGQGMINTSSKSTSSNKYSDRRLFAAVGCLQYPLLINEIYDVNFGTSEFTSVYNSSWKFTYLDERASAIVGYLPADVLGTSGYDYYHMDDLDHIVTCHHSLIQKRETTNCAYRFRTKSEQWVWLQSHFFITKSYSSSSVQSESIFCIHSVINHVTEKCLGQLDTRIS